MKTPSVRRYVDVDPAGIFALTEVRPVDVVVPPRHVWPVPFIALLSALALVPQIALADDPCEAPLKHVKAVSAALDKAAPPRSKPGTFDVKRLRFKNETDKFQVAYLIDGKGVFSQRMEQREEISEHFGVTSEKSGSALGLGYAFGAGGAVACEYEIVRTLNGFVVRRTK